MDKKIVRNDIKIAAKVITNLDKRWTLWEDDKASSGLVTNSILFC